MWRISLTMRLRLLVTTCTSTPTPPGPYPSNITSSSVSPSSFPVPRWMARSILSLGIFSFLAARMAVRRRGLVSGSPPPTRAAMVISRMSLVKTLPRRGVGRRFLVLDRGPFRVPRHGETFCRASSALKIVLRRAKSEHRKPPLKRANNWQEQQLRPCRVILA